MNFTGLLKINLLILSTILLASCGGSNNSGTSDNFKEKDITQLALDKISSYASNNGLSISPPTIQDYTDAGVTGVSISNLLKINQIVAGLSAVEADSEEELQTLVLELNTHKDEGTPQDEDTPLNEDIGDIQSAEILTIDTLSANKITATTALINWSLNKFATGQVEYGISTNYGQFSIKENSFKWNSHTQTLSDLIPDTTYHFRVTSVAKNGISAVSEDHIFRTTITNDTLQQGAILKIMDYSNGNTNKPTVQDYINAGVTRIDSSNLNQINTIVRNSSASEVNTTSKLQLLVNTFIKLIISSISVSSITPTTAEIAWSLDSLGTGKIEYGLIQEYDNATPNGNTFLLKHSHSLTNLIPNSQYHYRVTSTNEAGLATTSEDKTFNTTGTTFTSNFTVTQKTPALVNPTKIVLPRDITPTYIGQYSACGQGKVYSMTFADDEDVLITFDGASPLSFPVHINGGRNVIVRGLEIVLKTQPGNSAGSLTLKNQKYNLTNPHPIIPGCGALRLAVKNATHWIEGLYLDTKGHDADAIIVSGSNPEFSKVVIQNSLIEGIEGNMDLHGDILQTQGGHLKQLILENVTMRQALEGIVLSSPVDNVIMINVDYDTDSRFDSDDPWDDIVSGGFFADSVSGVPKVKSFSLKNIYIKYKNPNEDKFFTIAGKHFTSPESAGEVYRGLTTQAHPEVHFKKAPPSGNFVSKARVGSYY